MFRFRSNFAILPLALAVVLAACSDSDPVEPNPDPDPVPVEDVVGTYVANADSGSWTIIDAEGEPTDLLEVGAEIEIALDEDGNTTGTLFIPEWGEDGEDLEVDLAGTWELDDEVVTFSFEEETLLDGLEFAVEDGELVASYESEDEVVEVVLVRR